MAHFPASSRPVRNLVPAESLQPVELVPGISVVTLAAFEYRRSAQLQLKLGSWRQFEQRNSRTPVKTAA